MKKKEETNDKPQVFMNRELSWLKFNERVLEEAESDKTPFCERLNFASIYESNLNEFFMVRVGSLIDQEHNAPKAKDDNTQMTAREQLDAILAVVNEQAKRKDAVYRTLIKELAALGVRIVDFRKIGRQESARLERYFDSQIAPLIAPTIIEPRQPFPFMRGLETYAIAELLRKNGRSRLGIVSCQAANFPRLVEVSPKKYVLVEQLILHFIYKVFPGYTVKAKSLIRITRNADIDADALYDEDTDYREFMADLMKRRKRLAPVRMELSRQMDTKIIEQLCKVMNVKKKYIFRSNTPYDLSFFSQIQDVMRQQNELFYARRVPQRSPMFRAGRPILDQVAKEDKLLLYPYDSMKPMLDMLKEAADDESVVSIRMTLYRVAKQSQIVEALIDAAENGKDVLVLVELKARFDEENNIEWSRRLEAAGCRVIYGLDGYKVHSKLCLITRVEEGNPVYYTQIGTGNYNEKTARLYTDYCMMTADQKIGEEAAHVFDALSRGEVIEQSERLLVAPKCMRSKILEGIDGEIRRALDGKDAYVGVKCNSVTDRVVMEKLIEASRAGVHVDLIVRGICCLIPGIPGETENIRVISIVGRFLEHSRIYIFGSGRRAKMYISSADFMPRNLVRRVEIGAPVTDPRLRKRILEDFQLLLSDNTQAREMGSDGIYVRRTPGEETPVNSQEAMYQRAYDLSGSVSSKNPS